MKYSNSQLRIMAIRVESLRLKRDPKYSLVIAKIMTRTDLSRKQIEKNISILVTK